MLDNTNLFHLLTISYSKSVLAVEVGGTAVHSHNFAPSYLLKRTNLGRNLLHAVKYENTTQNHREECLVVVKTTYLSSDGCRNEDLQELQKPAPHVR